MATITKKPKTDKEILIDKLIKKGGVKGNRKALKSLQKFFQKNKDGFNSENIRERAWR
jgi:hypothetical protein